MARPLKYGVDYWNKDVSFYFDKKIRLIRSEFGAVGMYALDYIICDIYKNDGYYAVFDKDWCDLVSDGAVCGGSSNFIEELIKGCVRRSFFDKRVFDMFGVITSKGIQKRYIRMVSKRKEIYLIQEYFLLDPDNNDEVPKEIREKIILKSVSNGNNCVSDINNPINDGRNTQSKVKESKVKQSKAKQSGDPQADAPAAAAAAAPAIEKAFYDMTGRRFSDTDIRALEEMRDSGASDALILRVMEKVAGRGNAAVGSMRYYLPIVTEALSRAADKTRGRCPGTYDTAEIETILDEEFIRWVQDAGSGDYNFDE